MGPFLVVLPPPILRNILHFRKGLEQIEVQYLFPVGLVEPLNVRILCGLTWLDELQIHAVLLSLVSQQHGDQFRPVVHSQLGRQPAPSHYSIQNS